MRDILFFFFSVTSFFVYAENDLNRTLLDDGLPGRVSITVHSIDGIPIEGASVMFAFSVLNHQDPNIVKAVTDKNGIASGEAYVNDKIAIHVNKDGFYETFFYYNVWNAGKDCYKSGRWEPWDPMLNVVLYARIKPNNSPMLMKTAHHLTKEGVYGFDLLSKRMIDPGDKTGHADFYIWTSGSFYDRATQFSDKWQKIVILRFNHVGDGLIARKRNRESEFCFSYTAPISGYENPVEFIHSRANPEKSKPFPVHGEDYFIFRVSRINDATGELEPFYGIIESLNHGKDWDTGEPDFSITYRINTIPGDRNIEYN